MECAEDEKVLLATYQLQGTAQDWWASEWEVAFQSRPYRQITWREFVTAFERSYSPAHFRTERVQQFTELRQGDMTVMQYRARFVELGRYAPHVMTDEELRTHQFVQGLRPEIRQALVALRLPDLDSAYHSASAVETDLSRTRAQAPGRTGGLTRHGSIRQQTERQAGQTSGAVSGSGSTSFGSRLRRFWRRHGWGSGRRQQQEQSSAGSVQQPAPPLQRQTSVPAGAVSEVRGVPPGQAVYYNTHLFPV